MKKSLLLTILLSTQICLVQALSFGQTSSPIRHSLEVTMQKTTSIVFPFDIISADRGSADIIVKKATGVSNVLLVKASEQWFEETNLTVITSDSRIYEFTVYYSEAPAKLIHDITSSIHEGTYTPRSKHQLGRLIDRELDDEEIKKYAERVLRSTENLQRTGQKLGGVNFKIDGIYNKKDVIFYKLTLKNSSRLSYDIDFIRSYITEGKSTKRTASQEVETYPLQTFGLNHDGIVKGQSRSFVLAFKKTTLGKGKRLIIEVFEKQGDRNLTMRIKGRHLLRG